MRATTDGTNPIRLLACRACKGMIMLGLGSYFDKCHDKGVADICLRNHMRRHSSSFITSKDFREDVPKRVWNRSLGD